jgi:hypothetical protein
MRNKGLACGCGRRARVKGLCLSCYNMEQRANWTEEQRERYLEYQRSYYRSRGNSDKR